MTVNEVESEKEGSAKGLTVSATGSPVTTPFRWHSAPSSCSFNTTTIDYMNQLFLFVVGSWNQSKPNDNHVC